MSQTMPVFYIVGTDPKSGAKVHLAKFFSMKDAQTHLVAYERWHGPTVDVRHELRADQHEAHRDYEPPAPAPAPTVTQRSTPPSRLKS